MKRWYVKVLAMMLAVAMVFCLNACGSKDSDTEETPDTEVEEELTEEEDVEPEEEEPEEETEPLEVVKMVEGVDENRDGTKALQIESITLYEDGSLAIVPVDDLKKNEIKDDAEAVYPFEDSGEVEDFSVVEYGDEGYRTILALMKDGTISVVNGRALVEDHIFAVLDNVGSRDTFVKVEEQRNEETGTVSIIATTEEGDEVVLDYSMSFQDPEEEQ